MQELWACRHHFFPTQDSLWIFIINILKSPFFLPLPIALPGPGISERSAHPVMLPTCHGRGEGGHYDFMPCSRLRSFLLKFTYFKGFYKKAQSLGSMTFRIYEFVPVQSGRGMVCQLLTLWVRFFPLNHCLQNRSNETVFNTQNIIQEAQVYLLSPSPIRH